MLSPTKVFVASLLLTACTSAAYGTDYAALQKGKCRFLPGDKEWPSQREWDKLNATVAGRLIKTISPGHVCHDPTYDAEACKALTTSWALPQTQFVDPAGFTAAYQQNNSCNPFTPRESPCLQGNYVDYAINVSNPRDAIAGVKFAQKNNIRLVIKNTGHDYLGKSTGRGALSIWTHNLRTIEFVDYKSKAYTGVAAKLGAGVQGFKANNAASEHGRQILGGECLTVGIVGGYTQGGGHSLLSSKYGLGADQALEWEVVTAEGKFVTANPNKNSDLYWALSGGGGGTYGVVTSLTVKTYPDGIVGGALMGFLQAGISEDTYWGAVEFFHILLPTLVDAGAHVTWITQRTVFTLYEVTIPGASEALMRSLLKPFTDHLNARNVSYQSGFTSFPTYRQHIDAYLGPPPYGYNAVSSLLEGGVMFSRDTVAKHNKDIVAHMRKIATTTDFFFPAYAFNVGRRPAVPNAALPAWRDMLIYMESQQFWNFSIPFEEMVKQEPILTNTVMPPMQALASGAYMNEADFMNPKWKQEFYGENYGKLRRVKRKWDPKDLFYATTAVGSDAWTVAEDGRLCRR